MSADSIQQQQPQEQKIGAPTVPIIVAPGCCSMTRSPSRDNDLSQVPGSLGANVGRGSSPNPDNMRMYAKRLSRDFSDAAWFEDEMDVIKSCGALQSALGLPRSFSSSDITDVEKLSADYWPNTDDLDDIKLARCASELAINKGRIGSDVLMMTTTGGRMLGNTSRSLSTCVVVGDMASMSQLPSPNRFSGSVQNNCPPMSTLSANDFVRSVNKKVRQSYIQRRLVITYKALERLSHSEFNLHRMTPTPMAERNEQTPAGGSSKYLCVPQSGKKLYEGDIVACADTIKRYQPKPFSRFDRNVFIFNWLHNIKPENDAQGLDE
ncbi:uncharacterized protein LOC126844464 [Adelges cooleyi]|uniref:uncharacterized protein LOC126844464 n=1 Tax=Adelges cooleyi TaxID=133065 RepID=UPI00217F8AD4|nr:uncharacterized protein LOC126844464 [Adelges cooleyi]